VEDGQEVNVRAETQALLDRMRHLVSLNDPDHGGPYGGYAAEQFVSTMKDAIAEIERLAEADRWSDLVFEGERIVEIMVETPGGHWVARMPEDE